MNTLLNILTGCEIAAFLTGLVYWKKIKDTYWKWFTLYLLFIVITEFIGWYLLVIDSPEKNQAFYNYFEIPTEFLFFFFLFNQSYKTSKYKWLPIACTVIYLLSWMMDILYFSKLEFFFYSFSYTVGNLLLLVLILGYFIRLVTSDAILGFRQDMLFWVGTGMLIYYLGSFPYYGLRNTLIKNYQDAHVTYTYIMYVLNCLMYIMFSFSFIWGKPRSIISSS